LSVDYFLSTVEKYNLNVLLAGASSTFNEKYALMLLTMQSLINRNRVVLVHISFWWLYLSFFTYQISLYARGPEIDWSRVLTVVAIQTTCAMLTGYLNYFVFLPRFLAEKKGLRFIVEFLAAFLVVILLRIHLERYFIDHYTHQEKYLYHNPRFIIHVISSNLFTVIFLGMIRVVTEWFEFEARKKTVENERLIAELNFLKAQINPHFLFNTLNNLYYLAYTKSSNTPEVIAKLSQMMRYMIYDSNHALVPLNKEIEYMESYISLERLRLNDQIPIKFEVSGDATKFRIVPFIFITFLENAFKHGVSNNNPNAWVNVSVQIEGNSCIYQVENSKITSAKPEAEEKSGIGLQNVKRRLELSYPEQYELDVKDLPDQYIVTLRILLS
jgi:two-component system sensor histidine kinase AlgZ